MIGAGLVSSWLLLSLASHYHHKGLFAKLAPIKSCFIGANTLQSHIMNLRCLIYVTVATLVPLSGCNCNDGYEPGWEFQEDWQFGQDAAVDIGPDVEDVWDGSPDAEDVVDVADVADAEPDVDAVDPWQPEQVESVSRDQALTDRTGLAVDPDGTLWLGYHECGDFGCNEPQLKVVHRPFDGPADDGWSGQIIHPHEGIFGVSVIEPGRPIVVFPDSYDQTYKAAMRQPDGDWEMHTFPVSRSLQPRGDGFDVTNDGTSYFVSFAPSNASAVEFYAFDTSAANPTWQRKTPLSVANPQAAMERGLRADDGESVYLVNHSRESGTYGVYRYDEELDAWPQSVELDQYAIAFVHSLIITRDFQLCMSGDYEGDLLVTCGSMFDLTLDSKHFSREPLAERHPSSIIEGDDGTLYVAYNPPGNTELRVARRHPTSGTWTIETVFDGPSYGVSTAIAKSGDLVISYYTCDDTDRCSLQVLWETPPQ
jgi:hypothetical protein